MALLRIPDENRTISEPEAIAEYLAAIGIEYRRWETSGRISGDAPPEQILAGYGPEIERLKALGGYTTADVIDVKPETPGLGAMLAKFNREHWHDEDEVRFILKGRGLFHIHPRQGPVMAVEVEPGDLLRVPSGTWHWFDLCADRRIRAIRLFQNTSGWTPLYTGSGADANFQPLCLGPSYLRGQTVLR
jgi:1,2-dihydroxy-3-keto-5-methylthiopentene dioxygenase